MECRAYFFGNMYLSQIQQGIQAAHVTSNLFVKYIGGENKEAEKYLMDWASNDKTMILLDGGYQSSLLEIYNKFVQNESLFNFPFEMFREEHDALNDAVTSVGILLPLYIYDNIGVEDNIHSPEYRQAYELFLLSFFDDEMKRKFGVHYFNNGAVDACLELHRLVKSFKLA